MVLNSGLNAQWAKRVINEKAPVKIIMPPKIYQRYKNTLQSHIITNPLKYKSAIVVESDVKETQFIMED